MSAMRHFSIKSEKDETDEYKTCHAQVSCSGTEPRKLIHSNFKHCPKACPSLTDLKIELNVTPFYCYVVILSYQDSTNICSKTKLDL